MGAEISTMESALGDSERIWEGTADSSQSAHSVQYRVGYGGVDQTEHERRICGWRVCAGAAEDADGAHARRGRDVQRHWSARVQCAGLFHCAVLQQRLQLYAGKGVCAGRR